MGCGFSELFRCCQWSDVLVKSAVTTVSALVRTATDRLLYNEQSVHLKPDEQVNRLRLSPARRRPCRQIAREMDLNMTFADIEEVDRLPVLFLHFSA